MKTFFLLLKEMRPKQWTKNFLVFAALLFAVDSYTMSNWIQVFVGFLLFSFVASVVYILNDYFDREADKLHPEKRNRPIASGELNPALALFVGAILLVGSLYISYYLNHLFTLILTIYFIMNVLYSFKLKHVVIIDVMIIASGFVLRAVSGGLIIQIPVTPWFMICTMLVSLLLAFGKRRHELVTLKEKKGEHRRVLQEYNLAFLDQAIGIITTATMISYSFYTFTSSQTIHLMWTIPFVIYGLLRYVYLLQVKNKGGKPEKLIFEDKGLFWTSVLFIIVSVAILLVFVK